MIDPALSRPYGPEPRFEKERIVAEAEEDDEGGGRSTTGQEGGGRRRPRAAVNEVGTAAELNSSQSAPSEEADAESELMRQIESFNELLRDDTRLVCRLDRGERLPAVIVVDRDSETVVKRFRYSEVPQLFARLRQGCLLVDNKS